MRAGRNFQPLSYDLRLPDAAQADALRLLDASRLVVNAALVQLWPYLDDFMTEHPGPAWKQVGEFIGSPAPHGDRQWRCESETAGRILRAQAKRKQVFELIQPILSDGFMRPKTEQRPAGKNRQSIKEAIEALQKTLEEDDTAFVTMQNVVEQACNYFLEHGMFPHTYEDMQVIPLLKVGMLTYAGDDGSKKGQSYRLSFDVQAGTASLRFRFPDETGSWQWRKDPIILQLPACLVERLKAGVHMAPTLRELVTADGNRVAVLDVIVQVKQAELAPWKAIERVLGFDWGVHGLITAVVLSTNPADPEQPTQISRPLFVNTGGLDGHQAGVGLCPHQWGSTFNPQIHRAGQRRARQVAQLAQQHDHPRRDLAHLEVQKPPLGHTLPLGKAPWHLAHLPPLRQARPHLSLSSHTPSSRSREMGALAGVCALFLQC